MQGNGFNWKRLKEAKIKGKIKYLKITKFR